MSSSTLNIQPTKIAKQPLPWSLWLRQIAAIFRLEVTKNFLGRRSILLYLLALLPIVPLALLSPFTRPGDELQDFTRYSMIFAVYYGGLILRTVVFFGCAWIFMNLFRGDIVDRSLHFYFLSPVRREVLVVGKYLSGLVTSIVLFSATTILCMLPDTGERYLTTPLFAEIGVDMNDAELEISRSTPSARLPAKPS